MQLVDVPFAPLTQQYQTCRNDPFTAFVNQAGVSAGNVGLLTPAGVLLVLLLLAAYQRFTGRAIPKTYSASEKESALNALAVALLLIRDKRVRVCARASSNNATKQDANGEKCVQTPGSRIDLSADPPAEDLDAYDVDLLATLVEQLGNLATASESSQYMYRHDEDQEQEQETADNPMTKEWNGLGSKSHPDSMERLSEAGGAGTEMVQVSQSSNHNNL